MMVRLFIYLLATLIGFSPTQGSVRSLPPTIEGIHVFNDQIDVHNLSDAQVAFAATHYVGTQKLTRQAAQRLRAYNPNFIVLHYRLGLGIGYRAANDACQPTGESLSIIHGDEWVQEWPGDEALPEAWFYHHVDERVYWCAWGWYLMDVDHPDWRDWWLEQVLQQIADNDNDGLFADSVTVPNYLGYDDWQPALPAVDAAFENEWARRIESWLDWLNNALGDRLLIVNAGSWVNGRNTTDYSLADGVMIEGFAGWDEYDRFAFEDWQLQMDRILGLVAQDRAVIAQSYVSDAPERLWTLANYLLIKGDHTYINLETTQDAEWFPEYDLPVGSPLAAVPATVAELQDAATGLYLRPYSGGLVVVNPDPDGTPQTLHLDAPMQQVIGAEGGGDLPIDADISGWGVITTPVTAVTVAPGQAAILLNDAQAASATPAESTEPVAAIESQQVAGTIDAFHRSGQTFLTWDETPGAVNYRIYRHTALLDVAALGAQSPVAEVPQGSAIFWTERARALEPPYEDQFSGYRSLQNYTITDGGPELPDETGLFVWTAAENGNFYYTVTTGTGDMIGTTGPISEQTAIPQSVLAWASPDGLSRVYTQFMDYANYNPTFDAPRAGNSFLGLPNWEELEKTRTQQYAYNYWVGLPTPEMCGGSVPDVLPLVLEIEGWGSRYGVPPSSPWWCAVHIWGDDPSQSWYFGFSAMHDYHSDDPVLSGPIVNYTETRLLAAVQETIARQASPAIDPQRVYVYGHSMGGTGTLALAERYPNVFAGGAASQPMLNFGTAQIWLPELESKWGAQALNLPIESRGPDAAHLAKYNGTGVWDWQNLAGQLVARRGDDMALIAITHGTQDTVIDWQSVVRPAYAQFYAGNRAFIGEIYAIDHTWTGFREHANWPFDAMLLPRNESLPALANASGSLPALPDSPGGYNMTLEWSSSINNFAGPITDQPEQWAVALRSLNGTQTVDVTPRRLQQFQVEPGRAYTWENTRLTDGALIQSGTVQADADGLLTIVGFQVEPDGNRLSIRAVP